MSGSSEDEGFLLVKTEPAFAPSNGASDVSTKVSAHGTGEANPTETYLTELAALEECNLDKRDATE